MIDGWRPWEINRLTVPQLKLILGIDDAKPETFRWNDVEEMYHKRQVGIFAAMAAAAGGTVKGLVDLPIDRLEELCVKVAPEANIDRLKMRACLLKHAENNA